MTHPKISPELIARAAALSTPELCDGMEPYRAMHYEIKPLVGDRVVGQAFTADLPMGSSKLAARMIDEAGAGDILVLAGRGDCRGSLWGDYKSLCASLKKIGGVVIDGALRDIAGCREIGLPVFARVVVCGAVKKSDYGALGVTVSCGGVSVRPGDLIAGDANGVVVLPYEEEELAKILDRAEKKKAAQEEKERKLLSAEI